MSLVTPVPVDDPALPMPDPNDMGTWAARMAEQHRWLREDLGPGVNGLASGAYLNAIESKASAQLAESLAYFVGAWSSQTGAATPPMSVEHAGDFWTLVSAVPDITVQEPGVSSVWSKRGESGSPAAQNSFDNALSGAAATNVQAAIDELFSEKVTWTGATGAVIGSSGTTAQRPGSPGSGNWRFNTDLLSFEGWNGTAWTPMTGEHYLISPASGSSISVTDIPPGVKKIRAAIDGLSTNTNGALMAVRLGSDALLASSGYTGSYWGANSSSVTFGNALSTGVTLAGLQAADSMNGVLEITWVTGTKYHVSWVGNSYPGIARQSAEAFVTLSDVLGQLNFYTSAGSMDAGSIALHWEF